MSKTSDKLGVVVTDEPSHYMAPPPPDGGGPAMNMSLRDAIALWVINVPASCDCTEAMCSRVADGAYALADAMIERRRR